MNTEKALSEIGLSEGEIKVYMALLKLGPSPASAIKEETRLHRTTIYDFVEKLLNKGLINYVVKNNTKHYKATHPEKLLDFVKEKEDHVKNVLPELIKLSEFQKEELKVEVYRGEEGFKTVLNDIVRTKSDMVGFGVDEVRFKNKFPITMENYFRKEEELGLTERILVSDKTGFVFDKKTIKYRYIPDEFFSPTPTLIYDNKVITVIWEPFNVIMIENPGLADGFRKHFELLWKMAKTKPANPVEKLKE